MSRRHLTRKQHAFLEYLQGHVDERKIWPTYREIVDHFDYRSPNSVTQNLQALARKGFLRRDRDGYHLVHRDGSDGAIAVRWTLEAGQLEPLTATESLSLAALFQDVTAVGALKLGDHIGRPPELADADYVFMSEGDVPEGSVAVTLDGDTLDLRPIGPDSRLDRDGSPAPTVLGTYAGHAGPYGVVRHTTATRAVRNNESVLT